MDFALEGGMKIATIMIMHMEYTAVILFEQTYKQNKYVKINTNCDNLI